VLSSKLNFKNVLFLNCIELQYEVLNIKGYDDTEARVDFSLDF